MIFIDRISSPADRQWNVSPVGLVRSTYTEKYGTSKQATISREIAIVQLFPGYEECLLGLDGFDYVWVITLLHLDKGHKNKILTRPKGGKDGERVGLFASRAPHRPNPVGLSALHLLEVDVKKGSLIVEGIDYLQNTPVLDIKPYIPAFDAFPNARAGWMDVISEDVMKSREEGYQEF